MKKLAPTAEASGYKVLYRPSNKSMRSLLESTRYLDFVIEPFRRHLIKYLFILRTLFIKNAQIIFIHPQTAGFSTCQNLCKKNNVSYYVVDNSFFCIRSYNVKPDSFDECTQCLGKPGAQHIKCRPAPNRKLSSQRNVYYLLKLKELSSRITFLAQNELQKKLIKEHFGEETSCLVVGMDTGELDYFSERDRSIINDNKYDLVYHGANSLAKGILYFIELSSYLPDFSCVLPASKQKVEDVVGRKIYLENLYFVECIWETGLKEMVSRARIVINPSLWSAPIEGALLKSFAFNAHVATVKSDYGYEKEIACYMDQLRLARDPKEGASQIKKFLEHDIYESKKTIADNRQKLLSLKKSHNIGNIL